MADLQTPMCMVLTTLGLDYERKVHVGCNATYVGPIITSLPSVWRFLQCLRQYRDEDRNVRRARGGARRRWYPSPESDPAGSRDGGLLTA